MNRPSNMRAQQQPIFADALAWHMLSAEQALEWLGVIVSEWPSAAPLATCGQACRFLEQARRRRLTRHKHFGLTLQRLLVLAPLQPLIHRGGHRGKVFRQRLKYADASMKRDSHLAPDPLNLGGLRYEAAVFVQ